MAYSKVILNGTTIMDVTQDTVAAENLLSGETATMNNGVRTTGTVAVPTKTSDLTNDSGFITSAQAPVQSVNGQTGTVSITIPTVPSASTTAPSMDGTASYGSGTTWARADHVHPTDTSRQAALVSGTNIKTINNESLLGSGNIDIQGGGSAVENIVFIINQNNSHYPEGVYLAQKGMTWSEWCASDYNTTGYYVSDGLVNKSGGLWHISTNSDSVSPSASIINSYLYDLTGGGGND